MKCSNKLLPKANSQRERERYNTHQCTERTFLYPVQFNTKRSDSMGPFVVRHWAAQAYYASPAYLFKSPDNADGRRKFTFPNGILYFETNSPVCPITLVLIGDWASETYSKRRRCWVHQRPILLSASSARSSVVIASCCVEIIRCRAIRDRVIRQRERKWWKTRKKSCNTSTWKEMVKNT